ncbi:MAG: chromosomal replication initiator protein DnaA [Dehalococcoidia bacterium]
MPTGDVMDPAETKRIWDTALGELQLQVTRPYYETYLKNTVGLECQGDRFIVGAPTSFTVEWLYLRMRPRIEEALRGITKRPISAQFIVCQDPSPPHQTATQSSTKSSEPARPEDTPQDGWTPPPGDGDNAPATPSYLNHKYTFASFVVGGFNRMAHAAARAVAEGKGQSYNPLFIYSSIGLGKTHLLHAIGHAALLAHKQVLYTSAEQFTNDLITAIRERSSQSFRDKYREVDVLLVDDIQFIGGKQQTQEGFYHTFNHLHNANKQIVIASDCHPREIPVVEDRLVSRFEGGLLADILPPDLETRVTILQAKAAHRGVKVAEEVLDIVARQAHGSVRRLEGALNRVIAYAGVSKCPITPELVVEALSGNRQGDAQGLSPDIIIESAAAYFNIDPVEMCSKRRLKRLVGARDIAMYLLREELKLSPMRIGALMGDRTPAAVTLSCRKITTKLPKDTKLHHDVSIIRDSLYSRASAG